MYLASSLFRLSPFRRHLAPTNSYIFRLSSNYVTVERRADVAVLKIDNPNSKVNSLSPPFALELLEKLKEVESDKSVISTVLISNKPNCFIAGADIKMLASVSSEQEAEKLSAEAQSLMSTLEESKKPIVAAIMGSCLGGGLELALACPYRIAVDTKSTVFGLPEVKLGLLPGSGGTQRFVKHCSRLDKAFQYMMTGSTFGAPEAKRLRLVHQVLSPLGPGLLTPTENTLWYLESVAVQSARELANRQLRIPSEPLLKSFLLSSLLKKEQIRQWLFIGIRYLAKKKTNDLYPAPLKMLDLFESSITEGSSTGYQMESKLFGELAMTKESKALVGLFFSRSECKKTQLAPPKQPVKQLGVLGAGLMGAGISFVSIQHDIPTVLKDVSSPNLVRAEEYIQSNLRKLIKKKRISELESIRKLNLLEQSIDLNSLRNVDMVIEAIFEDLSLKQKAVKEVESVLPPHAVFASNTSALPIHVISQASNRPEKFIGMHYFSPVDKMELLEIIITDKTSQDTVSTAMDVGLRQGKVIILVKDNPGFYTTRVLGPMLSEAIQLLQEGVSPEMLDEASKTFGWPIGCAALADEVGIDVVCHVAETLAEAFPSRMKGGNLNILKEMVSMGFLGRKSNSGIYGYAKVEKSPRFANIEFTHILRKYRVEPKGVNDPEHIHYRLFTRFVNEAVLCLQEGILVNGAVAGDVGAVYGLGFPPHFGGPFRYLDLYGASGLVERMENFRQLYGDQFAPCQLLLDHAKDSTKRFHKV